MALRIIWNDILQEKADVIVTPASRNPRIGTGLDKLVHQVAGPELLEARKGLGNIGPGKVAVSFSFGLKKKTGAKYVIHALGPTCIAKESSDVSDELILDGCYLRILCKALWDDVKAKEREAWRRSMAESGAKETAYGEFLVNQDELAAATGISKRTIRYYCSEGKGAVMTSRDKIFALAVAMKLSVNCTEALLAACDYRFTNSLRDTVIRDYIQRRQGTVDGLNYRLSDMKLGKLQVKDER